MVHKVIDRCKETTSTTGAGNLTLTGAVAGFVSVASGLAANGDTGWFCAENGPQWEVFLGTRVSATVLARTTVISSSNGGAAVNFSSPPVVFSTVPAARILPVAFSAYRSGSNQSVVPNSYVKVQLNSKAFDTASAFDNTANYRFTAPISGIYRFEFSAALTATAPSSVVARLYKNGNALVAGSEGATVSAWSEGVSTGSALVQLVAADYIELFVFPTGTSPVIKTSDSYLSGSLVVPLG